MNADGSGVRRLTHGASGSPAWSPDGRRIAFRGDKSDIYVVDVDGSGQRRLAQSAGDPVWSPDGRRIAFERRFARGAEIHVMNADGSGQRRLTRSAGLGVDWSPDGRKIAFVSDRDGGRGQIFVMNADGSGQRRLTQRG